MSRTRPIPTPATADFQLHIIRSTNANTNNSLTHYYSLTNHECYNLIHHYIPSLHLNRDRDRDVIETGIEKGINHNHNDDILLPIFYHSMNQWNDNDTSKQQQNTIEMTLEIPNDLYEDLSTSLATVRFQSNGVEVSDGDAEEDGGIEQGIGGIDGDTEGRSILRIVIIWCQEYLIMYTNGHEGMIEKYMDSMKNQMNINNDTDNDIDGVTEEGVGDRYTLSSVVLKWIEICISDYVNLLKRYSYEVDAIEQIIGVMSSYERRDIIRRIGVVRNHIIALRLILCRSVHMLNSVMEVSMNHKNNKGHITGFEFTDTGDSSSWYKLTRVVEWNIDKSDEILSHLLIVQTSYITHSTDEWTFRSIRSYSNMRTSEAMAVIVETMKQIVLLWAVNLQVPFQKFQTNTIEALTPFIVLGSTMLIYVICSMIALKYRDLF